MIITRLILKNWRNFQALDIPLGNRTFIVGPNAAGKSNLLDALRFLRDLAQNGGGLQKAVNIRGGISKIRSLSARKDPTIRIEIHLAENLGDEVSWKYILEIKQESRGNRQSIISLEQVWKANELLVNRPEASDEKDPLRKTQTYLEQVNSNVQFREVADFFDSIKYLHVVPQLVRHSGAFSGPGIPGDPFGQHFLESLAVTSEKTRRSRLNRIQEALKVAVPQLDALEFKKDEKGFPHLEATYAHWRPNAGKQREDQFSDGTLRLIGFLWSLMEGSSTMLLEEPELSLHPGVVSMLPSIIFRIARKRQIIVTTHSADILADHGIGPNEILILKPGKNGTEASTISKIKEVNELLRAGFSIGEAVLPYTKPKNLEQLLLPFE